MEQANNNPRKWQFPPKRQSPNGGGRKSPDANQGQNAVTSGCSGESELFGCRNFANGITFVA
jgi:hypothetical protein